MHSNSRHSQGFTLLELSIALVIIGLIAGGIIFGREMIEAAGIRAVISDVSKLRTSMYAYREKYNAVPGDMKNATTYWGVAHATPATCVTTASTGTETCDGNGNNRVDTLGEYYRFWQHMNSAGLWEQKLTGAPGASPGITGYDDQLDVNIPRSQYRSHPGYAVASWWSPNGFSNFPRGNTLTIAPCCHPTIKEIEGRSMRPTDVANLDTKLDDGQPDGGFIEIYPGYSACVTSTALGPAEYAVTDPDYECQPLISLDSN